MRRREKPIADDERLTQYGNKNSPIAGRSFKNRPPVPTQVNALSLLRGEHSVAEAAALIQTSRSSPSPGSGVRYTTAARLRQDGFPVRPTGNNKNPYHVSVTCVDEKHMWTEDDSVRFDACFGEPTWEEG